jgi:hypothetical protein
MTIDFLRNEIYRFLESPTPEVLCISGKWGTGKTYVWNECLQKSQENKSIKMQKYSYVSMFGKNSIDDVRTEIVENTVDSRKVGLKPSEETLMYIDKDAITKFATVFGKKMGLFSLLGGLPLLANYMPLLRKGLFLGLKNQIICMDDIERSGSGLDTKNLMGLISELKDSKLCKIVILLNTEALDDKNKIDFLDHLEKTADTVMDFRPTPQQCAEIGITKNSRFSAWLSNNSIQIGITNIRVIKKIEEVCRILDILLKDYDDRVLQAAVHTAALGVFAKLQPQEAPPIQFIKSFNNMADLIRKTSGKSDDPNESHIAFLRRYGFNHMNDFDAVVFRGIENGFFDKTALLERAYDFQKRLFLEDKDRSFSEAWRMYHDSFEDDAEKVLDALVSACRNCYESITPINLNSTVILLKEFGRADDANDIIRLYVNSRDEKLQFWNVYDPSHFSSITDPDLLAAFKQKYNELSPKNETRDVLLRLGSSNSWNVDDELHLVNISPEEFYNIFKKSPPEELHDILRGANFFMKFGNPNQEQAAINAAVRTALLRIADENLMNRKRVERYLGSLGPPPSVGP